MTASTPWGHLPNAPHIDRVLTHSRAHPQRWGAVWHAAWDARAAAWGAAWADAWAHAWAAALGATRDDAWDAARGESWRAARGACAALIAWDDCAPILDMPPDAVRLLAAAGHHPAVLLLPAVLALAEESIQ